MGIRRVALIFFLVAAALGCDNQGLRAREKGALTGAALGAGLGAIVGNQTGDTGPGVAIGAAIGALSGALIGNEIDNQDAVVDERERRVAEQEGLIEENKRLIEELRKRGTDARGTDRGVVVNLPDVLFEFDSARLTAEARKNAREIAEVVRDLEDRRVSVEGHTDSVGTIPYNQRLSQERARAVASELMANGVSKRRVSTQGFGESDPIASNKTDYGRQRNRRVEVVIEN